MTIQSINAEILAGGFTNDQLTSIGDAIKFARAQLARNVANTLRVGATVQFRSNRNGVTYKGTLEKVKLKNAIVNTQQGRYNVPMSMLEAV
jgi:hypothetical protein